MYVLVHLTLLLLVYTVCKHMCSKDFVFVCVLQVKGVDVSFADMDMRLLINDSFTHSLVKNITLNSTSYTMTGLHPGIAYRFSLQLQDSRGHTGNRSLCHPCLTKEIGK